MRSRTPGSLALALACTVAGVCGLVLRTSCAARRALEERPSAAAAAPIASPLRAIDDMSIARPANDAAVARAASNLIRPLGASAIRARGEGREALGPARELDAPASGRIEGRLVQSRRPLPAGIYALVARAVEPSDAGGERWSARAIPAPDTGAFAFEHVPAGEVDLSLDLEEWPRRVTQRVAVAGGATSRVELHHSGRELTDGVWVRFCSPSDPDVTIELDDAPSPERVHLRGGAHEAARPVPYEGVLLFTGLDPGVYDVVVDDPAYHAVAASSVRPGHGVSIAIAGSAEIALAVRDERTSELLCSYRAELSRSSARRGSSIAILQRESDPPPPDGIHRGIVPRWDELVVSAPGKGIARLALDDLRAGETLALEAVLGQCRRIAGRVVDENGAGVATDVVVRSADELASGIRGGGAPVSGFFVAEADDAWGEPASTAPLVSRARTGADGRFTIDDVPTGRWIVDASADEWFCAAVLVDTTSGASLDVELEQRRREEHETR